MLHPLPSDGRSPAPIEAFGQTWHFTPGVLKALKPYGIGDTTSLEALVIDLTSIKGLEDGVHQVNYLGMELRLLVRENSILVESLELDL